MCMHGELVPIQIINPEQTEKSVLVDACISDEIDFLNCHGVITLSCCCGHGKAGQIAEWENDYGAWKGRYDPPLALISGDSLQKARTLGYRPFPYFYADGSHDNVWQIHLKTGCLIEEECVEWQRRRANTLLLS